MLKVQSTGWTIITFSWLIYKNRSPMWKTSENICHDGHPRSFCILTKKIYEILQKRKFHCNRKCIKGGKQQSSNRTVLKPHTSMINLLNCRCQLKVHYLSNKLFTAELESKRKWRKFRVNSWIHVPVHTPQNIIKLGYSHNLLNLFQSYLSNF